MKFFISGEIDALVYDLYTPVRQLVEKRLNDALADKDYGPALSSIGIIPIIMRPEWEADRNERKLFQRKQHGADYRMYIAFEEFRSGNLEDRVRLLIGNIVVAIEDLQRKAGRGFKGGALVDDVLTLFQVDRERLRLG
ncbi:MAG: hypothetical protein JWO39_2883 [Gemmatimonadetes bacterium]|nr:hypothetical protein [Gemmatimonadota bacterium]